MNEPTTTPVDAQRQMIPFAPRFDVPAPDARVSINPVKGVLSTLFTRKFSILLIATMVEIGIGVTVFWLLAPTYESKARMHVDLDIAATPVMRTQNTFGSDLEKMTFFETVVQEIETPSLIQDVVRRLELDKNRKIGRIEWLMDQFKEFKRTLGRLLEIESWQTPPDPFGASVKALRDNLATSRLENSNILEIVYHAKDGEECTRTLQAVVDAYIDYRNDFVRSKATSSAKFLELEMDRVRGELNALETRLLEALRSEAMPLVREAMDPSDTARTSALIGVLSNPAAVEQMMLRVLSMQEEMEKLVADGRQSHPSFALTRSLIDEYVKAVNKSPDVQQRLHALHRELQAKERAYETLVATHETVLTMASEDFRRLNAITLTERASAAGASISPQRTLAMISGLVLGLLLGIIYALVSEFADSTIKTPEDIRTRLGLQHVISLRRT
ncbi:MAG: hypothetical protein U1F36_22295 [Planctomycetota bacterium]